MNRRRFLGQFALGSAAYATLDRMNPSLAAQTPPGLTVKFIGMMGYFTRSDRSLMVAMPGVHGAGHYSHIPFLMGRAGSAISRSLGLDPARGVVAGAFDYQLADAPSEGFVFRCLEGADLQIVSRDADAGVDHRATHLAQMNHITRGKRVRGDLRRWSAATVSVEGGTLDNSAAHPDAGKIWSFGNHRQPLTDATLYRTPSAAIRLTVGQQVFKHRSGNQPDELWVVSAAGPNTGTPNPKRLEHSLVLFDYYSDATPVIATCEEAEGRITLATEYPSCASPAFVSRGGGGAARTAPPFLEMCPGGGGGCCE